MYRPIRATRVFLFLVAGLSCAAHAADDVDALARDVDRLSSLRQAKDLQRACANYAQAGLWNEMAGLFTSGWTNVDGADLPIVPYHFSLDESGVPLPAPAGAASQAFSMSRSTRPRRSSTRPMHAATWSTTIVKHCRTRRR